MNKALGYGEVCGMLADNLSRCIGTKTVPLRNRRGRVVYWLCSICQRREISARVTGNKHRARGRLTERMIERVLTQQHERCALCRTKLRIKGVLTFDLDHIRPVSRGGTNSLANLQALCPHCNRTKSDRYESANAL